MAHTDYRELLENALREIQRLRRERELLPQRDAEPIAIIGMACRLPGSSLPQELWEISNGAVDCIGRVPIDRWDADKYYDPLPGTAGKMTATEGGFIDNIRDFDAEFFGISPREARSMDPQQRILLEVVSEAIERAAIASDLLFGANVGVFVGLANLEYANLIRATGRAEMIDSYFGTGNAASVAAGRIAYAFGFKGPTFTLDTACSSSLVAIHLAASSLRRQECKMAVVAGINLMLAPETSIHFSNARMLASDGRCKPFSAQANGYGRGEGCGAVLLKRLKDALTDGDPIDAIIAGSAVNHDGRSAGLTAPNGPSQESVMHAALTDAGLQARDVTFVEAHGTGTPLGDPIEAGAIARVYGAERSAADPVLISAIKANIGHTEGAAGIAGLIHACMCLQNRRIPPLLHLHEQSQHIPFPTLHFTKTGVDLSSEFRPLRAAVSSFGFSGTNAHVILQEHLVSTRVTSAERNDLANPKPSLFVLSAKSSAALRQYALNFRDWLTTNPKTSWLDVCYTLQFGRNAYEQRLAFIARTAPEAITCLNQFLAGEVIDSVHMSALSQQFVEGATVDWKKCNEVNGTRRLCLPTYPFQRTTHWLSDGPDKSPSSSAGPAASLLAPVSYILDTQAWQKLNDHQLFGAAVMPAVVWLDVAYRAAKQCMEKPFQLQQIRFAQMLVVSRGVSPTFETRLLSTTQSESEFGISLQRSTTDSCDLNAAMVRGHISTMVDDWLGGELAEHQNRCTDELNVDALYDRFQTIGLIYGPHFRKLSRLFKSKNSALGKLEAASLPWPTGQSVNPDHGLWDSALHTIAGAAWHAGQDGYDANDGTAFFPVSIRAAQWFETCGEPAWSMATICSASDEYALEADVFVWNELRQPMLQLRGVKLEGFSTQQAQRADAKRSTVPTDASYAEETARLTTTSLLALPPADRLQRLQEHLRTELARELEMPVEKLTSDQPLSDFGLDSLMVFRLGIQLESEFGFALNSQALMQGQSLRALSESLLWRLDQLSSLAE